MLGKAGLAALGPVAVGLALAVYKVGNAGLVLAVVIGKILQRGLPGARRESVVIWIALVVLQLRFGCGHCRRFGKFVY